MLITATPNKISPKIPLLSTLVPIFVDSSNVIFWGGSSCPSRVKRRGKGVKEVLKLPEIEKESKTVEASKSCAMMPHRSHSLV